MMRDPSTDPLDGLRDILPKLAINIGWLKLMGEAMIEQKRRQSLHTAPLPVSAEQSAHLTRKKAARKPHKGYRALALAIKTAA